MEQSLLFIIAGLFLFGAVIIWLSSFVVSDKRKVNELWTLYGTEFVIVGVVLVPAYIGGLAFAIAVTLIGLAMLWELYRLLEKPMLVGVQDEGLTLIRFPTPFKLIGMGAGLMLFASAYWFKSSGAMVAIIPVAAIVLLTCNLFAVISPAATAALGFVQLGLLYPVLFFAHILLIGNQPDGFVLIVFLYAVVELNDAFALLFGKLWGRRKIFPHLSPKKTLEGSLSGMICALIAAVGLGVLIPQFTWQGALVGGFLIVLFTVIGDLVASKLKRDVGVKDFGNILPRQGGVLDIYDSLVFAAPIFYWYLYLLAL